MEPVYQIKLQIVDDYGEIVVEGGTSFYYSDVRPFGDCAKADAEVGNLMRRFIQRVDQEEEQRQWENEVAKDLSEAKI